jgi:toxin ParE1/3/4
MAKARPRIVRGRSAILDLTEAADSIAQAASLATSDRFLAAVNRTFEQLTAMPDMGTRYEPDDPAYAELRYLPVSKFRKYLVFYRPMSDGIEVVRVLHGARDIAGILAETFQVAEDEDDGGTP